MGVGIQLHVPFSLSVRSQISHSTPWVESNEKTLQKCFVNCEESYKYRDVYDSWGSFSVQLKTDFSV